MSGKNTVCFQVSRFSLTRQHFIFSKCVSDTGLSPSGLPTAFWAYLNERHQWMLNKYLLIDKVMRYLNFWWNQSSCHLINLFYQSQPTACIMGATQMVSLHMCTWPALLQFPFTGVNKSVQDIDCKIQNDSLCFNSGHDSLTFLACKFWLGMTWP